MRQIEIKLLTGIPRSGTTLCCALLNQVNGIVALHEPLDPQTLNTTDSAIEQLKVRINTLTQDVIDGRPILHGDSKTLQVSNPIAELPATNAEGLRPLNSTRGLLEIPAQSNLKQLIIKQNAMFTALSTELLAHYQVFAICRNPVDVLASWMTVNLPVNKGRVPGGERFCSQLVAKLDNQTSVLERQLLIYSWFIDKFSQPGLSVIRYEDVVDSGGALLIESVLGTANGQSTLIEPPKRQFSHAVKQQLASPTALAFFEQSNAFYSSNEMHAALDRILA